MRDESGRHHAHVWALQIECVIKFRLCLVG